MQWRICTFNCFFLFRSKPMLKAWYVTVALLTILALVYFFILYRIDQIYSRYMSGEYDHMDSLIKIVYCIAKLLAIAAITIALVTLFEVLLDNATVSLRRS